MRQVKIGDITEVLTGQSAPQDPNAFGESGIPFIRAGSLQGLQNGKREEDFELINQDFAKKYRLKLFPKNTLIFAKSGMSAKLGRIYRLKTPSYLVSHLAAILPSEDLNPGYLERWLHKNPPSRLIPNDAYPSIKTSSIASMKIELPELGYQEHVAKILDKADVLRQKRKESIKLLDDYLRSTFLEMFGDPFYNPKHWSKNQLSELIIGDPQNGFFAKNDCYQENGVPIIWLSDFIDLFYSKKDGLKKVIATENDIDKYKVNYGDVLFCRSSLNVIGIGKASIVPKNIQKNTIFECHIIKILLDTQQVIPEFFRILSDSNYFRRQIMQKAKTATMTTISQEAISSSEIIVPPIELQNKFGDSVHQVEKLKAKYNESERELDNLFGSLMQRAFKGEL